MIFGVSAFLEKKEKKRSGLWPLYEIGLLFSKKEADSVSSQPKAILASKESSGSLNIKARFIEMHETPKPAFETVGPHVFRVVLIEEGMGNSKDGFYYTKEVLQEAAPLFEGKKIYADHPSLTEESDRPERTVRDIVGHFEECQFVVDEKTNRGRIEAKAHTLPDDPYRWARALMRHAVDYSSKYPDKLFIGLSINAGGEAQSVGIREFLESGKVIEQARHKLLDALDNGAETVRVVTQIQSVVSADLVTEPGAGGRVLAILESDRKEQMDEKKSVEEKEQKEMPKDIPADTNTVNQKPAMPHSDEEQDRALIADMLKKALGDDSELSEESIEACREAYEAYIEMGYSEQDAVMHASHAMKLANHIAKKRESVMEKDEEKPELKDEKEEKPEVKDTDAKESGEPEEKKDEVVESKESDTVMQLRGEIARLKESLAARDLDDHMDSVLASSGLKKSVTDKFRESIKGVKTTKDFDRLYGLFMEGYKQAESRVSEPTSLLFLEKETTNAEGSEGSSMTLSDCVD